MTSIPRVIGTDLATECVREQDDHRAEQRIGTLSWTNELRLHECYWRDLLQPFDDLSKPSL